MAVKLVHHPGSDTILVLSGYEGGLTAVHQLAPGSSSSVTPAQLIYLSQPHSQPILSLDVSPDVRTYYTSSADAIIAGHRIPELPSATAQENGKLTVAEPSLPDLDSEVGKQPQGEPIDATQDSTLPPTQPFAPLSFAKQPTQSPATGEPAGLSSLLSSTSNPAQRQAKKNAPRPPQQFKPVAPYKISNTKHSGQQSLRVRSDNRLIVTGGWDTRIRIYSTKTLKEVCVLKWHKEGVYAVDFAAVLGRGDLEKEVDEEEGVLAKRETGLAKLQRQREQDMQTRHWVVAGSKDGKVSLWEVF
jgi:hypothetical protein